MTFRRRITRPPLPSAPLRRALSPAEHIAIAPIITAARQAGAAGIVLVMRGGAEIVLSFPADDDKPERVGGPAL
jgi:hypothetical protein